MTDSEPKKLARPEPDLPVVESLLPLMKPRKPPGPRRHPLYQLTFCVVQLLTLGAFALAITSKPGVHQSVYGMCALTLTAILMMAAPVIYVLGRKRRSRTAMLSTAFGLAAWPVAICFAIIAVLSGPEGDLVFGMPWQLPMTLGGLIMGTAALVSAVASLDVATKLPLLGEDSGVKRLGCGEHDVSNGCEVCVDVLPG